MPLTYGSIWYLYFRVMKSLRISETYPRIYGSFRISLRGVCWPRWTDWRLPSLLTRLPRAARVSMSEHGKRCNKSSCESSNIGESQYAKMIEHAWLLRHKPSELGFCSWIPIIEKRCKIVESCTQRKLVGLALSIGWHVGQTWPNYIMLYGVQGGKVHCQLRNRNPIRKIHTCFLMAIWDGVQTYDTRIRPKFAYTHTVYSVVCLRA